jgi:hypothetical protein
VKYVLAAALCLAGCNSGSRSNPESWWVSPLIIVGWVVMIVGCAGIAVLLDERRARAQIGYMQHLIRQQIHAAQHDAIEARLPFPQPPHVGTSTVVPPKKLEITVEFKRTERDVL